MKRTKIAAVGLGFGKWMVEQHLAAGTGAEYFELAAVCDLQRERAVAVAQQFHVKAHRDLDSLLADDSIPAIALFTGPVGRAALIRKIIRAGKHVMTTKPFELDPEAAAEVLREARQLKRAVHLNSPTASLSEDFRQIERWRNQYNLGRPLAAEHHAWYKRVERADGSWYDDPSLCPVAPIFRLGIYGINDMVRIFGAPDSVQVMETRLLTGRPTPDLAQLTIKFKTGAIAHSLAGWCLQPRAGEESLTIYFENGTVHRSPALTPAPEGHSTLCVVPAANHDGRPAETVTLPERQLSLAYQWDVFYHAIHGIEPADPTPPEIIVNGIQIIAAMKRAAKSGHTEKVL